MKYIFVTGGVVSGLGKGICAASLGRLLKQCGLRVKNQKFDLHAAALDGTAHGHRAAAAKHIVTVSARVMYCSGRKVPSA